MLLNGIENIGEIKKLFRRFKPDVVLFCLDFDGTLVKISRNPYDVAIPGELKEFLVRASMIENAYFAILSGRALIDIITRIGIKNNIIYSGTHGFEIKSYYRTLNLNYTLKNSKYYIFLLKRLFKEVEKLHIKNLILEDKKYSVALHYRILNSEQTKNLKAGVRNIMKNNTEFNERLHITRGKKLIEIRPKVEWSKGSTAGLITERLIERLEGGSKKRKVKILRVNVGDDLTDETMFTQDYDFKVKTDATSTRAVVKMLNCVIGRKSKTSAAYFLNSHKQTPFFIEKIIELFEGCMPK